MDKLDFIKKKMALAGVMAQLLAQWVYTFPSEWLRFKKLITLDVSENMEEMEFSCPAGGNGKWQKKSNSAVS